MGGGVAGLSCGVVKSYEDGGGPIIRRGAYCSVRRLLLLWVPNYCSGDVFKINLLD